MDRSLKKIVKLISALILALLLFENSYEVVWALTDYFDPNTPGVDICKALRHLVSPSNNPYKVGSFTATTSASTGANTNGPPPPGGLEAQCIQCINANPNNSWSLEKHLCYNGIASCVQDLSPVNINAWSNFCIQDESECSAEASPPNAGAVAPPSNSSTGGGIVSGDIFQKWFIDTCVMDGYLTEVAHIDQIHDFEIKGSVFEGGFLGIGAQEKMNLGKLFEEAFMEVTRAVEVGPRIKRADLELASLKDFFLVLKDSNEQFMTDLMQAVTTKGGITGSGLEALQAYELAKIEKAREDVNKLMYEVYRELKEEPLVVDRELTGSILRSMGLRISGGSTTTCPFGALVDLGQGTKECVVIKKEGRIIQNVDDFVYEEAIQKTRDFVMCYFAPWRHFPIGEDYYFAASSSERSKVLKNNKFLRDGTEPDFTAIDTVGGMPFCGEDRVAQIEQGLPQITEAEYPGLPAAYYSLNVCGAARREGSQDLKLIRDCEQAIRERLDETCNTEDICEAARANAGDRPDLFEPTVIMPDDEVPAGGETYAQLCAREPDNVDCKYIGRSKSFEDYKKFLCPSDQIKEDIKRDFLFSLARKYKFLYNAPPENWYYHPYDATTGGDKKKCALILASLGRDVEGVIEDELGDPLRDNTRRAYKYYQEKTWKPDLLIAVAYRPDPNDEDYNRQLNGSAKNTGDGIQAHLQNIIAEISSDYQTIRLAEYTTGGGLRAEKHLIGFPDKDNKYFFIDTENIISPALFLQEKIAAATQAQFDLAQLAWKRQPEGPGGGQVSCPHPFVGETGSVKDRIADRITDELYKALGPILGPVLAEPLGEFIAGLIAQAIPGFDPNMTPEQLKDALVKQVSDWIGTGLSVWISTNYPVLAWAAPTIGDIVSNLISGIIDGIIKTIAPDLFPDSQDLADFERMCKRGELEHGWYLVNTSVSTSTPEYECRWPQFNDLTCSVFGYVVTSPIYGTGETGELPQELPAPWEDFGEYMKVATSYKEWFAGDQGLRKAPPAFEREDYAQTYSDLDVSYPEIYGKAYGDEVEFPATSWDYYTNRWYKDMIQLYEKPMSEILRTWFVEEGFELYPGSGANADALARLLAGLPPGLLPPWLQALIQGLDLKEITELISKFNPDEMRRLFQDLLPDLNGYLPDLDELLPDFAQLLPDIHKLIPDLNKYLPDLNDILPDLATVLPDLPTFPDILADLNKILPDISKYFPDFFTR